MKLRQCKFCTMLFPADKRRPIRGHVRVHHPAEWQALQQQLRNVDDKLASLEEAAHTLSHGWFIEEPVERIRIEDVEYV